VGVLGTSASKASEKPVACCALDLGVRVHRHRGQRHHHQQHPNHEIELPFSDLWNSGVVVTELQSCGTAGIPGTGHVFGMGVREAEGLVVGDDGLEPPTSSV
jgi:hypothetical protein